MSIIDIWRTPVWPLFSMLPAARTYRVEQRLHKFNQSLPYEGIPVELEARLMRAGVDGFNPRCILPKASIALPLYHESIEKDKLSHIRGSQPELLAKQFWNRKEYPLGVDLYQLAGAALTGHGSNRTTPIATSRFSNGLRLGYLPSGLIAQHLNQLGTDYHAMSAMPPLLRALALYVDYLRIHPLPDGNGRTARLLYQLSLRDSLGLRQPILPLAPAVYHFRPYVGRAFQCLYFDQDPAPITDFFLEYISALLDLFNAP
ncbi:hypothetical protein DMP17_10585 [Pseudonocardia sp. TMWB2A]|uniref:Fic family protein n=1 Tax=Pseudonocardia sp. TMWB2A TaxID=687430 RepID=UPI00307E4A81